MRAWSQAVEREELGSQSCESHFGGKWLQTSYNANFRNKYAVIGDTYDPAANLFVSPPIELPSE